MTTQQNDRVAGVLVVHGQAPEVMSDHGLVDADYCDRFTLSTSVVATPEDWARAMFGDSPDRALWTQLSRVRRRLAPGLLTNAEATISARRAVPAS